jgi:Flp pilus assembly pilin Flp
MSVLKRILVKARENQSGQTMTEYGLILAFVAVVAVVAYTALGTSVSTLVSSVASSL